MRNMATSSSRRAARRRHRRHRQQRMVFPAPTEPVELSSRGPCKLTDDYITRKINQFGSPFNFHESSSRSIACIPVRTCSICATGAAINVIRANVPFIAPFAARPPPRCRIRPPTGADMGRPATGSADVCATSACPHNLDSSPAAHSKSTVADLDLIPTASAASRVSTSVRRHSACGSSRLRRCHRPPPRRRRGSAPIRRRWSITLREATDHRCDASRISNHRAAHRVSTSRSTTALAADVHHGGQSRTRHRGRLPGRDHTAARLCHLGDPFCPTKKRSTSSSSCKRAGCFSDAFFIQPRLPARVIQQARRRLG